jgi:hypothetical protein
LSRKNGLNDARKWSYLEAPDPEKRSGMDWATMTLGYPPVIKHGNSKSLIDRGSKGKTNY